MGLLCTSAVLFMGLIMQMIQEGGSLGQEWHALVAIG